MDEEGDDDDFLHGVVAVAAKDRRSVVLLDLEVKDTGVETD